jgi:2-amino-4-hydroxy-6-hydroxymethyldihydropteridine diphosphokinase
MPRIWLSLGSNLERDWHINKALDALTAHLGTGIQSPVYESPAAGFDGPDFYNLVIGFDTNLSPEALMDFLAELEQQLGRTRNEKRFSSRTIDIDLLTYGGELLTVRGKQLPRDDILEYSFVLQPLADVASTERHPLNGLTYHELWNQMRAQAAPLREVQLKPFSQ